MALIEDKAVALEIWLKKRRRMELVEAGVAAIVSFAVLVGVLTLATIPITFFILFALSLIHRSTTITQWIWILSFGPIIILPILVVVTIRTRKKYLDDITWPDPEVSDNCVLIRHLLHSGGRLVDVSFACARQFRGLWRLDVRATAQVFEILAAQECRVSFREICSRLPGMDHASVFRQLREFPGVVFLVKDPAGMSLTEELRQELRGLTGGSEWEPRGESGPIESESTFSEEDRYFEMLGLKRSATLAEAKSAYRRLMKLYHPDRMAGLGSELREIAEENTKNLNEAYEHVQAQLGAEEAVN